MNKRQRKKRFKQMRSLAVYLIFNDKKYLSVSERRAIWFFKRSVLAGRATEGKQ